MRTGAEYRESLRDGRNVWVMGEGPVDDVTTHPATSAMVEEYRKWYDRHFDSDWQDTLLTEPDVNGQRRPLAFEAPDQREEQEHHRCEPAHRQGVRPKDEPARQQADSEYRQSQL